MALKYLGHGNRMEGLIFPKEFSHGGPLLKTYEGHSLWRMSETSLLIHDARNTPESVL